MSDKLKAWAHWASLNPIDDDQREMASDVNRLIAEHDDLKDRYEQACESDNAWRVKAEELEAKLAIATEALEAIELDNHVHSDSYVIAREALEKIK